IAAIASDNGLALSCTTPNTTLTASGGTSYLWSNGATTAAITVTTAGTFLVTVKNANGCWATASVNTTLDKILPIAAIASDNGLALSCTTPNTTLSASGGTSYLWSNGATTAAITVATAGTFSVTVKNANGCSATASVNTTLDNTLPIAAIASDNGLALSCTTPNTTLTASGGTSYLWSNGATTPAITVATAGTFSVTVKNSNGCSAIASVNTTLDNTLPIAAIASDNGLALNCTTPNTTLTASGGTSYLWSNGATTPAITVATAGTFSVTVKNANGCSATASVTTTLDNTLPIAAIVSDNGLALSCTTPNTTLTASGGTSYLWLNGATTASIIVTTAGTFSVTVKNANGCSATASVTTTLDNSLPIAAIASDNGLALSCNTPNSTLTASGGTSYLWSNGATTPAIAVATAGTFSVTVKNANGCSVIASVNTTLDNTLPVAAIASDNGLALSCTTPNTTLTASGGTSYLWSNGATTPAITVATAGTFSVTVKNANGCSAIASVNTTLDNTLPVISISSQTDAYCFGENNGTISIITEGGKSPYTYAWTKNNIAYSTSKDLIGLSQGIYKVIATADNGCSSDELKVIIQQPNAAITATAIIIDNTNCVGCSNGSITQTISGGTLPYTYLWSNGATTKDITDLIKGNYSVEIKDKNGCVANYSYSIQESGIALVKKGIFYDSNTDGFAQAGEIINYTFIVTNTGNVTINSIVITDPMKGLTIKNNSIASLNAGENTTITGIYILTQADINAGKVINSAVAIGKDPKGNEVKDISGTQQNNDTATETPLNQKASIAITKDGIYIDANKDGITNLGDKIVYSFMLINTGDVILTQVNISDNLEGLVITGSPITLQIGESNATSFSATYSITQADIDSGLVYNLATVTGTTPYNDKVTATSTDPTPCMNCIPKTDCKNCTITTLNQSANLVVYKTAAVTGYSLVGEIINYKIIVRNSGNVTLHQIVVTDPLTGLNTIISVLAPGTEQEFNESYTITKNDLDNNSVINIANAKGLTPTNAEIKASDTVEIDKAFVLGCRSIVVHNAFSPNGDGINDVFTIDDISETNCYPENTVEIYNRWGVLIFRTKNYNNQTNNFDGISQGRTTVSESTGLPSGTYFYILNYTSIDGNGTIQNNKKEGFLYLTK
ncbi:gliding motility-associated C-terminal domain-containing protein, partial [Flavobacterium sp. I-SCBP12n]